MGEGQGKSGQQPGDKGGQQPGAPGNAQGKAGAGNEAGGERPAGQQGDGAGEGSAEAVEAAEDANLEFTKQAADLVLKRLEDELERGEVDQELLEKLGWNEADAKKFAERLRQQLAEKGEDNSPEALARRRQFEETLKSLDLRSKATRRDDANQRKQVQEGIGPRRPPVPAEYKEAYELYRKTLAKQQEAAKE
jgi:hypothetical protein